MFPLFGTSTGWFLNCCCCKNVCCSRKSDIQQELGVPTRFIGLGERVEDFQPFDSKRFVEELL